MFPQLTRWWGHSRSIVRTIGIVTGMTLSFPVAAPAAAQSHIDPTCRNDPRPSQCVEAERRRMLEQYDVPSIEQRRSAGDQVRRVFYVDGYGDDLLLIEFRRARGGDPGVWVYFPRRQSEDRIEPFHASVPQEVWQDVLARSTVFDRAPVPLPVAPRTAPICLHGRRYMVEATDPLPSGGEMTTVRRAVENQCHPGLAQQYAVDVERATLPFFPPCARLASSRHGGAAAQLAACRILYGDRTAAAEVLNLAEAFQAISGPGDAGRLSRALTDAAVIDWNGERNVGGGSAATFWATHATPSIGVTNLIYRSVDGERADRVRLVGLLMRSVDTPRGRATGSEIARVEQIWTGEGGLFRVESATVGPWEPYPPR